MTDEVKIEITARGGREAARDVQVLEGQVTRLGPASTRTARQTADLTGQVSHLQRATRAAGGGVAALLGTVGRGIVTVAKFGGVAAGAATAIGIKTAAGMETAQIGFTTMLGSAEKAQSFLADLSKFAAKTPFDLPGLQQSASSLVSAGIDASKVIPIMTSLGNATSGMGTGAEGVQRATVALQQMNAAQRITGEDLNQLRDAGVPVFDLLAAATGKSVKAVAELAQKGKLGKTELDQLMGALESGKGLERFNGLMDAQSQTMTGLWSTLKDTFSVGMAEAIQPVVPLIKDGLGGAISLVSRLLPKVQEGVASFVGGLQGEGPLSGFTGRLNTLGLGLRATWAAFQDGDVTSDGFVGNMERVGVAVRGIVDAVKGFDWSQLSGGGGDGLAALGPGLQSAVEALPAFNDMLSVTGTVVGFAADHLDLLAKALPYLAAGYVVVKTAQVGANLVSVLSVPLKVAEILATRQLVRANRDLAASRVLGAGVATVATGAETTHTAAKSRGLLATVRQTGAAIAHRGVLIAGTVATGIATGAQWLLNAALSANPIGLVVLAVAGLTAGLVIAYKKSETFRGVVDGVWDAVKTAAEWVWNLTSNFTPLGLALSNADTLARGVGDAFKWVWQQAEKVWKWIGRTIDKVKEIPGGGLLSKAFNAFGGDEPRAMGGPVRRGTPYLVGEQGPERFIPSQNGHIVNAYDTAALMRRHAAAPRGVKAVGGDGATASSYPGSTRIAFQVDRRTLVEATLDELDARRGR